MAIVGSVFVGIAAVLHVYIFFMESIAWRTPPIWKRFGLANQADADTTATLAYNQGFYNLFLAIGAALGVILYWTDARPAGLALVLLSAGSMLAASVVLLTSGPGRLRAAAVQGTMPLLGVIFFLLALGF
jgi:putative membrane protein